MDKSVIKIGRFAVSSVVVIFSFFVSGVVSAFLAESGGFWREPFTGFFAAFAVVLAGYFSAPSHKQVAAVMWFILGCLAAWFLVGSSHYPEGYEKAYEPTSIPLLITYLGGGVALLLCLVLHAKRNNKKQSAG